MKRYQQQFKPHECAPKEWRETPHMTGSHELDAVINKNKNGSIPHRMKFFLEDDIGYGGLSGYNAYHGYTGDN